MNKRTKVLFSWSGGKDSSLALSEIQKSRNYEVAALITTITSDYDRVSMHSLRTVLLDEQSGSLDIPLEKVLISKKASNEEYESRFKEVILKYKESGIRQVMFGDIFLEDIKKYREQLLLARKKNQIGFQHLKELSRSISEAIGGKRQFSMARGFHQ